MSKENKAKFKGSDIIFQRFKWDDGIDLNKVTIGYLDRFKGVLEIKFNDFKGVHDDKDGIPLHRIRYFKINNLIVWDREQRIDLLTGHDISKYFDQQEDELMKKNDETKNSFETKDANYVRDDIQNGNIEEYSFKSNDWQILKSNSNKPVFIGTLKLLTYNVLSTINFKKSIKRALERDAYGIEVFENVDRINKIIECILKSNADLITLQECDLYEENKIKESNEIRTKYFICSANLADHDNSGCLILSKIRPVSSKLVKLSDNSSKVAMVLHLSVKIDSLTKPSDIYLVNLHLSSNMSKDPMLKRREQLSKIIDYLNNNLCNESLKQYFILAGDFNLLEGGDDDVTVDKLLNFNNFIELTKTYAFNPQINLTAALTASIKQPKRLDRIYIKTNSIKPDFIKLHEELINKEPIEINSPIKRDSCYYAPYNDTLNDYIGLSQDKLYLHASDHFGLEVTIDFINSIHGAKTTVQSALAIVSYENNELIQEIRKLNDKCFLRWPAHINLLYPFYRPQADTNALASDLFECLLKKEPFNIKLNKLNYFANNQVVYLEPSDAQQIKKLIDLQFELRRLFNDDSTLSTWRNEFKPHMTVGQPIDRRSVDNNWAKTKYDELLRQYKNNINLDLNVNCVYWLIRNGDEPFKVNCVIPLGQRYPLLRLPLNNNYENGLNRFINELSVTKEQEDNIVNGYKQIFNLVNQKLILLNDHFYYDTPSYRILPTGSYVFNIKSDDIDLIIVKQRDVKENVNEFAIKLTQELNQNDRFKLVRYINDAQIPIIEIVLDSFNELNKPLIDNNIHVIDIQLQEFDDLSLLNFNYTKQQINEQDYLKLCYLSGIFENQSLKIFIKNFKQFQLLLTFVKKWSKSKGIYGKAFGYLGCISYAILIVYYLINQDVSIESIDLIKGFFEYYSKFNWSYDIVSLIDLEQIDNESKGKQFKRERSFINILQTQYPYNNTSKNINKNAAYIISNEFKNAFNLINEKKDSNDYELCECLCKEINKNDLSNQCLKVNIEYSDKDTIHNVYSIIKSKTQALVAYIEQRLLIAYHDTYLRVFPELDIQLNDNDSSFYKYKANYYISIIGKELTQEIKQEILDYCNNNFILNIRNLTLLNDYFINFEIY